MVTQLQFVTLNGNALTGTLPPEFSTLTRLTAVNLNSNALTGPLPAAWSTLTQLQAIYLDDNALTGPLPAAWSTLTQLAFGISVLNNELTGPLPAAWGGMGLMADLILGYNALTGPLPAAWGGMTRLVSLALCHNALTGPLPPAWGGMASLASLALFDNALTGPLLAAWGSGMAQLTALYAFSNAGLCGVVPAGTLATALRGFSGVQGLNASQGTQLGELCASPPAGAPSGRLPPAWMHYPRMRAWVGATMYMRGCVGAPCACLDV